MRGYPPPNGGINHNLSLDKGPRAGIICWFHTRITRSNHTMKFSAIAFLAVAATPAAAFGPATPLSVVPSAGSSSALSMVLEKPKKLSKLEVLKTQSHHLENPLREVRCFALLWFFLLALLFRLFWALLVSASFFCGRKKSDPQLHSRPCRCRSKENDIPVAGRR